MCASNVNELYEVLKKLKENGHGNDELEFYTLDDVIPILTEIKSIVPDGIGHVEITLV